MAGLYIFFPLSIILLASSVAAEKPLNILGLFPHPGISHSQFFSPIMRGLAEAGHEVTVISHFPEKDPPERYRELLLTGTESLKNTVNLKIFEKRYFFNHLLEFFLLHEWGMHACNTTLNSEALASVLQENAKYDVIIMEHFNTDCLMGVAHVLKAPVIALSSCGLMPWHYERMGTPIIPSYIPVLMLGKSEDMSLFERVENWLSFHIHKMMYSLIAVPAADDLLRKKFGHNIPSVGELVKDTSAFFTNHHFSLTGPKPLPPSVIELGGIHIQKAKPLSAELQSFLDNAEHGVVLISWGSMIRAESLSPAKREGIIKAVKRLKQRVIWKWENDTLSNKPDNMYISKWIPQRDILCHPNVKVFMTHAGLMGSSEAVYCGVPVVATPMYGDQFLNAASLEYRGMGVVLPYEDISEDAVFDAVTKAMQKQYMQNAKTISRTFKHRPHTALQTAIWWVEYVAQTKGAPLTKSSSAHMSRFVYYSLDVYLLLGCVVFVLVYIWILIIRKFCLGRQKLEKIKQT